MRVLGSIVRCGERTTREEFEKLPRFSETNRNERRICLLNSRNMKRSYRDGQREVDLSGRHRDAAG